MIEAVHIIDEGIRPDMLGQLELLAEPGERIVSAGPPPGEHAGRACPEPVDGACPELVERVESVHCTMGSPRLAGWRMRDRVGDAQVICAWSDKALLAGRELALTTGRAMVYLVPAAPTDANARKVLAEAVGPGLLNVIAPTRFARSRLVAMGLPERFCHVLPPAALAPEDRAAARRKVRRALEIPDGAKLLVSPDPFVRHAGHEYASWAHAMLRHIPLELRLAFPSSGVMEEHYRFFAATTGFDEEVFFTHGRLPAAEVIAAADVVVLPQTRDCGAAMMASAMAAGVAVAARGAGSLGELAGGGSFALAMAAGPRATSAALLQLIEGEALSARLGQAAEARAGEAFEPTVVTHGLQEIYARAIETKAF